MNHPVKKYSLFFSLLCCIQLAFANPAINAIKNDDIKTLLEITKANPELLTTPEKDSGWLPMHFAAHMGKIAAISTMLINKADINLKDDYGYTPLHYAAKWPSDMRKTIDLLLNKGAEIEAVSLKGSTPLQLAVINGAEHNAYTLAKAGANTQIVSSEGITLLHYAASPAVVKNHNGNASSKYGMVQFALEQEIDPKAKDNKGDTALAYLMGWGATMKKIKYSTMYHPLERMCQSLGKVSDVNSQNNEGNTALHLAAKEGDEIMTKCLLTFKPDINITNKAGLTALEIAITNNFVEIATLLSQ